MAQANSNIAAAMASSGELINDERVDPGLRSDALRARSVALMRAGHFDAAHLACVEAIAEARLAEDPYRQAQSAIDAGNALSQAGHASRALDAYGEALAMVAPSSNLAALALVNVGVLAEATGDYNLMLRFCSMAQHTLPDGELKAGAAMASGFALFHLMRPLEAKASLSLAVALTAHRPDHVYRNDALSMLSLIEAQQGHVQLARDTLRQVIERCEGSGMAVSSLKARCSLGEVESMAGNLSAAIEIGEGCIEAIRGLKLDLLTCKLLNWLSKAHASRGEPLRAYELLKEGCMLKARSTDSEVASLLREQLFGLWMRFASTARASGPAQPPIFRTAAVAAKQAGLSQQDTDLLERVALGATNPQIASATGESINTVRNRLSRVMRKLGASSRTTVITVALARGVLQRA